MAPVGSRCVSWGDDGGKEEALLHLPHFALQLRDIGDFDGDFLARRDVADLCVRIRKEKSISKREREL